MKKRTPIPPELDARLRDEPDAAELARVWDLLGEAAPEPSDADGAAWDRLRAATLDAPASRRTADRAADRAPRRSERRRVRILAPVLAALLAVAGWVYLSAPVSVTAPAGSFTTVALPDGSTVELNSGSAIEYPRAFWRLPFIAAETRAVRLVGEAYFDVETDGRPFVVETADARVRVLGTAFNVRTRDGSTVVTVAEGRVQVDGTAAAEAVVLDAGERARVVGGVPTVEASGVAQALAWRSRGFAAQGVPLAAVLAELERRFAVEITLNAPDAAGDTLTLYFPQPTDAEAILRDLCTARDLRYRRTSRGFEVY
ncbi:MAG: FecR domain-containing protein [Rhodothermales bacterium]